MRIRPSRMSTVSALSSLSTVRVAVLMAVVIWTGQQALGQTATIQPAEIVGKPLYQLSDQELGEYITTLHQSIPNPADRVAASALKCCGQPYAENASMFSHLQTDCTTFVEHALAMGMGDTRESYIRLITRLRYADGNIPLPSGELTISNYRLTPSNKSDESMLLDNRNHFVIAQWVPNNAWCLDDITKQLGTWSIKPWLPLHHIVRPKQLFAKYGREVDVPDVKVVDSFVPRDAVFGVLSELKPGDVVLVIVGDWTNRYCDHMGIINVDTRNTTRLDLAVKIIHSAPPHVHRETLLQFINNNPRIKGIKVLRLREDASDAAAREETTMKTRIAVPVAN